MKNMNMNEINVTATVYNVSMYATENDDYNELWVTPEGKFFARHTCGVPQFYYVSDPLGYCELDHRCHDDVVFVICDNKGNKLFWVTNEDGAEFLTLKEMYLSEWNKIKNDYHHFGDNVTASWWSEYFGNGSTMTTDKWLLSFMDPAKYGKEIADMYGYEENWVMHVKTIKRDIIHEFEYLGTPYYIVRETQKHDVCGKEIIAYYVDEHITLDEYEGHVAFLDDYCEGKPGPMYTKREAINKVAEALKEIYKGERISKVHHSYGGYYYERLVFNYADAARDMIKSTNRAYIDALIRNEEREHTFFVHGDPAIEEKYPGYHKDHLYNYDHLGRRW